jgi:hypothetical protein
MPNAPSRLPAITRFIVGLVTNRSPVDTPFSLQGLNTIPHHDALIDGLNTEVSQYDTMQRRPGWISYLTGSTVDTWQYKDLNGNIFILRDTGTSLVQAANTLQTNSAGASAWTLQGRGNFLYGANGVDLVRIDDNGSSLYATRPWGQITPHTVPTLTFSSLGFFNATTAFIPTADVVGGSIVVTDPSNQRTLTMTIFPTSNSIHFNVTYTGNPVTTNAAYTLTTVNAVTGTAPNTTDVQTITQTSGLTDILTSAGVSNAVMNYYPATGVSTLDFDAAYTPPLTLSNLSGIINTQAAVNWAAKHVNVPLAPAVQLEVFTSTTIINGLYHAPGQPPIRSQIGNALNLKFNAYYDYAPATGSTVQFTSALYDTTNPQYSLTAQIGSAPRLYQFVSPSALVTDTFSGQLSLNIYNGTNNINTFTFVNQTMAQMQQTMLSSFWAPIYVQTGTTCYLVIRNFQATSTPSQTQDSVLSMELNTLVNNQDTNENFQNWTFLESNDWAQAPQQGVNIAYATRDVFSGGLSNLSPPVTVGPQVYPCRWGVSLNLPYAVYNPAAPAPANGNQNIEVYRTVDGGSSYLYEQLMAYTNLTTYTTSFSFTDTALNDQLIGPIDEEADPPPRGLSNIVAHTGRMFGKVGNKVYYSGGPDTANGNGDEAWPPGNYFAFPGPVIDILSMDTGLAVALGDDLHVITGVDSSSYYAKPWLDNYGISNKNAWVQDGSAIYIYTSKQQLHLLSPNTSREIGFDIGDQLLASFPALTTSVTFHRGSSLDTALYLSNGTNSIFRYNPDKRVWSPKAAPLVTAGRVKSLETAIGVNTLINSTASGVWSRSLTTFSDNNLPYSAFFTIGVMQVAPQGQVASLQNIGIQGSGLGTTPSLFVLLNETVASTAAPFLQIFQPVNDPPDAPASISLMAKRWYVESTIAPFRTGTKLINLASVKIQFNSTDIVKNEIYGVFLRDQL